jgi:predicted nucleic acid-binding protein
MLRTKLAAEVEEVIRAPDTDMHVPALCDVEVASALRRGLLSGALTQRRAEEGLGDYLDLPLRRYGHQALIARVLALRGNFSAYDAIYVALAERIGAEILTADQSLARAVRNHTEIATLPAR